LNGTLRVTRYVVCFSFAASTTAASGSDSRYPDWVRIKVAGPSRRVLLKLCAPDIFRTA
jgi:hypothetical protein